MSRFSSGSLFGSIRDVARGAFPRRPLRVTQRRTPVVGTLFLKDDNVRRLDRFIALM
jgi:hypothetical protein